VWPPLLSWTFVTRTLRSNTELEQVVSDVLDALLAVEVSLESFKTHQLGVGPYGEPQLVKRIAQHSNSLPAYKNSVQTRKTPDLLIPDQWAIEPKSQAPSMTMAKRPKTGRLTSSMTEGARPPRSTGDPAQSSPSPASPPSACAHAVRTRCLSGTWRSR
jgi:hypothetical protein